jgi:hypothetical protein
LSDLPKATARGKKPYKRHLSNYLLNKELQLRYIAFVTVLSAIISGSLGYLIWKQEKRATSAIAESFSSMVDGAESEDEKATWQELKRETAGDLSSGDTNLLLVMIGIGIGLVLVLSLYVLIMTHKVAGPLYKVSNYFDKMKEGCLGDTWPLRKGDMLQDFYEDFRVMHVAVREQAKQDNELVGRFLTACADAGVGDEGEAGQAVAKLEKHKQQRDQALA